MTENNPEETQDRSTESPEPSPSKQSVRSSYLEFLEIAIKTIAAVAAVSGVIANLWLYAFRQINEGQIAARADLSTYKNYGGLLSEYHEIEPAIGRFLASKQYLSLEKNQSDINKDGSSKDPKSHDRICDRLLEKNTKSQTGFELFNSKQYEDYRQIHNFYETLGFSLKNKLITFDNVFNLFIYPAYWEPGNSSKTLAPFYKLELCLGKNWFGKDKPLKDFSENFLQLGYNYRYKRLSAELKNSDSTKSPEKHARLTREKEEIDREHGTSSKESWEKLYPDLCKKPRNLWEILHGDCRTW